MAAPETAGIAECEHCHDARGVAVKLNRSGLAYYRCDCCGFEARHHLQRTSDAYMRQFEKSGESPPQETGKKPENAQPVRSRGLSIADQIFGGAS